MAVDSLRIDENTSLSYTEVLAERLANLPLRCENVEQFSLPDECPCAGAICAQCSVTFTLHAWYDERSPILSPPTLTAKYQEVYAGQLVSSDPRVTVYDARQILVQLPPHGRIDLVARAIRGRGVFARKWRPVVVASFDADEFGGYLLHFESSGVRSPLAILDEALKEIGNVPPPLPTRLWGREIDPTVQVRSPLRSWKETAF